jgi:hypothetical protein
MNSVQNTGINPSLNSKVYQTTIPSHPQWLPAIVNLLLVNVICPAMIINTKCLNMWLKRHPDTAIVQYTD